MQEKPVVKRSATEMFALIEKRKAGNIPVENFCKEQGIAKSAYYYWQKKYKMAGVNKTNIDDFIPVQFPPQQGMPAAHSAFAELILPGGITVRLLQPVSPAFIQSLLTSLC